MSSSRRSKALNFPEIPGEESRRYYPETPGEGSRPQDTSDSRAEIPSAPSPPPVVITNTKEARINYTISEDETASSGSKQSTLLLALKPSTTPSTQVHLGSPHRNDGVESLPYPLGMVARRTTIEVPPPSFPRRELAHGRPGQRQQINNISRRKASSIIHSEHGSYMSRIQGSQFARTEDNYDSHSAYSIPEDEEGRVAYEDPLNRAEFSASSGASSDLVQQILARIDSLEAQIGTRDETQSEDIPENVAPVSFLVLHEIRNHGGEEKHDDDSSDSSFDNDVVYLKEPIWESVDGQVSLKGRFPIPDPEEYIERKGNLAFVVKKGYSVRHQRAELDQAIKKNLPFPDPEPATHSIILVSKEIKGAASSYFAGFPDFSIDFLDILEEPFIWWYHCRKSNTLNNLEPREKELMTALTGWIETNYGSIYDQVDSTFEQGMVSSACIEYLIKPGEVVIWKRGEEVLGCLATSCPKPRRRDSLDMNSEKFKQVIKVDRISRRQEKLWMLRARRYDYSGVFSHNTSPLDIQLETKADDEEVSITSLGVVPLRFADLEVRKLLERRGRTFWTCRHRKLVSYNRFMETKTNTPQKFMVDYQTYKDLHDSPTPVKRTETSLLDMTSDEPPEVPELYLFPDTIHGFDLRRKKWADLRVDFIEEVTWNKKAFENLVADPETKQLIQALVTNQLAAEQGTDLIDNKGNGLIILLHGSPGTGKTFTAESVAEMAEKPLYPVTCGDVGTKPEHVEKYLESVFYLGKVWGCVVLLDEAEVFLEQRNLSDLERNALVSVFLRALEYYEGILILTSNRVGTFDEAFKSRIQLALHYENLKQHQRKEIWRNFFNRLRTLDGTNIDFDEIDGEIDDLSEYEMNGRQIRNAITTARQLAQFKKTTMRSGHLKQAIKVASKFDNYLKDVKGGRPDNKIAKIEDEENARMEGIR